MPDSHREPPLSGLRALGLIGTLGTVVATCTVAGTLGGVWLDQRAGSKGLLVVLGIFAGLAAGIYGAYNILARDLPWNR